TLGAMLAADCARIGHVQNRRESMPNRLAMGFIRWSFGFACFRGGFPKTLSLARLRESMTHRRPHKRPRRGPGGEQLLVIGPGMPRRNRGALHSLGSAPRPR